MTIKDLPALDPITAHWLNSQPLNNEFSTFIQGTEFFKETRYARNQGEWKLIENLIAEKLLHNQFPYVIKESAKEEFTADKVNNANKSLGYLLRRNNIQPVSLQIAAIAWYVSQIIDVEKTKELKQWESTVKEWKEWEARAKK